MLTREEAIKLLDDCDGKITLCGSDAHRIKHLLKQHLPSTRRINMNNFTFGRKITRKEFIEECLDPVEACRNYMGYDEFEKQYKSYRKSHNAPTDVMRKPISSSVCSMENITEIVSTCDDGSQFYLKIDSWSGGTINAEKWIKLPPIPQDDDKEQQ